MVHSPSAKTFSSDFFNTTMTSNHNNLNSNVVNDKESIKEQLK